MPGSSTPPTSPGVGDPLTAGRVLRATPERAVLRVRGAGGPRIVKVWRRPGWRGRWRSRRAARREAAIGAALSAAGAPVPRSLGVARVAGGWSASFEAVRCARTLEGWIERGERGLPARPARLARDAGRALAALHAAGLVQPDWHPENLLLDRAGRFTAIDFGRARLARFTTARAAAEWARLAGSLAGRVNWRLVELALRAWSRQLGLALPSPEELERLQRAARRDRAADVERHLDRWWRTSGRMAVRGGWLVRAEASDEALDPGPAGAPWTTRMVEHARRSVVRLDAPPAGVEAAWHGAARLVEHRLPGLVPLARPTRTPSWALFELRLEPPTTLEAALAELGERGLEWRGRIPSDPAWWPLERGPHSSATGSSTARLASTKRLMRSFR